MELEQRGFVIVTSNSDYPLKCGGNLEVIGNMYENKNLVDEYRKNQLK